MIHEAPHTRSIWGPEDELTRARPLTEDARTDVAVVGAGIAGLSAAYHLTRAGLSVVVLDDGLPGHGQTARTTAHLVNALDDRFYELERLHGEKGARLACESHTAAVDRIESIVRDEGIDCNFERLDGYLIVPPDRRGEREELLEREREAGLRAGVRGLERVERVPGMTFETGAALRFPNQGQLHPLRYLAGLIRAIERQGGRLFTHAHVAEFSGGKHAFVETREGLRVHADAVVVATNAPVNDRVTIHTKQYPYTTYVVGLKIPTHAAARALLWDGFWGGEDSYHYVRLVHGEGTPPGRMAKPVDENFAVLVVGGADHKTGQAEDYTHRYSALETWARERFPEAMEVEFRWSGQVLEPADGLAFIGRNPTGDSNVFIATGDSGNGMTHGTIAGMLLTDLIFNRPNEWATLYDPSRKSLRALGEFTRENLNVARRYGEWFMPADAVDSADEIAPGCGSIVQRGLKKLAVYRDENGETVEMSAVCAHLGCVVHWNDNEKSWDCPCHGSRYNAAGEVIDGPARRSLKGSVVAEPAPGATGSSRSA